MIDMIITKGLALTTVVKLLSLTLPFLIAMTIPMATLVAVVMAFGRLSADNEITTLKASGVNLFRLVQPIFICSIILTVGMIYFNDKILPETNHQFKNLMMAINRKHPTLSIEEGVFIKDFEGYQIYISKKDDRQSVIYGVIIHEIGPDNRIARTITARYGNLNYDKQFNAFVITLHDGEIHEIDPDNINRYRKVQFTTQKMNLVLDTELREDAVASRGDRELNINAMNEKIYFLEKEKVKTLNKIDIVKQQIKKAPPKSSKQSAQLSDSLKTPVKVDSTAKKKIDKFEIPISAAMQKKEINYPEDASQLLSFDAQLEQHTSRIKSLDRSINKYKVEIQKKYALPVACIIFVLIGAPMGVMGRRGFGIVFSLGAFLFYYVCLILGEELADRGIVSPYIAMWIANIILGVLGVFLLIKSNYEQVIIRSQIFVKFLPEKWKEKIITYLRTS